MRQAGRNRKPGLRVDGCPGKSIESEGDGLEIVVQVEGSKLIVVVISDHGGPVIVAIFAVPEGDAGGVAGRQHADFVLGAGLGTRRSQGGDLELLDAALVLLNEVRFYTNRNVEAGVDLEGKLHLLLLFLLGLCQSHRQAIHYIRPDIPTTYVGRRFSAGLSPSLLPGTVCAPKTGQEEPVPSPFGSL